MVKKRSCVNMLGIAVGAAVIVLALMQDPNITIENFELGLPNYKE